MNINQTDKNKEESCLTKVHFTYIVIILVAIIVVLLTVQWGGISNLASYLNFALGVASLLLAVIAIVYAFFANNAFTQTVAKLDSAATIIKEETGDLEKAVQGMQTQLVEIPNALNVLKDQVAKTQDSFNSAASKLDSATTTIKDQTGSLEIAVSGLQSQIKEIPVALRGLEGQVTKTHALVEQASKQPKIETALPTKNTSVEEYQALVVDAFLETTSWSGIKVVYLCYLALKKKKDFSLKEWAVIDENYDYSYGFLVAASCAGLIDYEMKDEKFTVTGIRNRLLETIRAEIDKRVKSNEKWPSQIKSIEDFIG